MRLAIIVRLAIICAILCLALLSIMARVGVEDHDHLPHHRFAAVKEAAFMDVVVEKVHPREQITLRDEDRAMAIMQADSSK
jgi:hypothetical protein